MREKMGVLLVEQGDGVSVQLFADPGSAKEIFKQLTGQDEMRVTFLEIDWGKKVVEGIIKELPEDLTGERMVGWKIGVGPIFSMVPFGIQKGVGDNEGERH